MALGVLVVRVIVGSLFVCHGAQKLWGRFGGPGVDGTARLFESVGLRPGRRLAAIAGWAQVVGGCLLVLGLYTAIGACALSAVMLLAIRMTPRSRGLWTSDGGYEYALVLVAILFGLSAGGAGAWSLDGALGTGAAGAGWAIGQLIVAAVGVGIALELSVAAGRSARRPAQRRPRSRVPSSTRP